MAHPHQEQLLNDLLRAMRAADEHGSAAGLEPSTMAVWDSREARRKERTGWKHGVAAGAMAAALLTFVAVSMLDLAVGPLPAPIGRPTRVVAEANTPIAVPWALPGLGMPASTISPAPIAQSPIAQSPIAQSPITQSPITQSPNAQSPVAQSPMEFAPLVPLTGHELSGPFQIIRVQMPRASLGAMAPLWEYPGQLVEADVLLGEDGMARAIRVSTNESVNSWRSR